nr:MAG TPA: hypothetical protein [Caudoviricetes sp.]
MTNRHKLLWYVGLFCPKVIYCMTKKQNNYQMI